MPLVAATNTAERITHVAIGAPGGASDWVAEIDAFGGHVNAALVALQQWGAPDAEDLPISSKAKDPTAARDLLAVAEAWVCEGTAARLNLPACARRLY